MSPGGRVLNPKGALLRFPRHTAQSATPEKEPCGDELCAVAMLFYFLCPSPLYDLIYHPPPLHFRGRGFIPG